VRYISSVLSINFLLSSFLLLSLLSGCAENSSSSNASAQSSSSSRSSFSSDHKKAERFYVGADLSYVNEMENCGASYKLNNETIDPFALFARAKANIIRVRLWHSPSMPYSNLTDVKKTIYRAKQFNMKVLLDFHYSDTWADPEKQFIPKAWEALQGDTSALSNAVYDYTYDVLHELKQENLLPDMIQTGNEINSEILQLESTMNASSINWQRNAQLINAGLKAVTDFNQKENRQIERMLHIAQPENALNWFPKAAAAQITDFEIIGLSYYPQWSSYPPASLGDAIVNLKAQFNKEVMIVETAYIWTLENFDQANNVLGEKSLIPEFPATPEGQYNYLMEISTEVINAGGMGIIYWEPAWVSTSCKTLWGTGSHWENASFFYPATGNEALKSILFFSDALTLYQAK
jgi:arabinogalactan endo-1,4-beta-galactosidase